MDAPAALYRGPIIDAHHHFWDLRLGKHPWLDGGTPDDGLQPLRRNYLPDDYRAAIDGENVVASVHVEANWDPGDPLGESRWLDELERPRGIAERYVAYVPLGSPEAAALLEQHARNPRTVGMREIISWHPDPAKRRVAANDRMDDPDWRANLGRLSRHGFCFELLLSPYQLLDARRLADDFPDITFVLNHCGSPMDRDREGMRRWRQGLQSLSGADNVAIKVSDPVAYDPAWTEQSLRDVIDCCLQAFGPGRALFATDFPVANLHIDMQTWFDIFRRAVASYDERDQRAMFAGNAGRIYQLSGYYALSSVGAAPAPTPD